MSAKEPPNADTAQLLSEFYRILTAHGAYSPEADQFLRNHQDKKEFVDLAHVAQSLRGSFHPEDSECGQLATRPGLGRWFRKWLYYFRNFNLIVGIPTLVLAFSDGIEMSVNMLRSTLGGEIVLAILSGLFAAIAMAEENFQDVLRRKDEDFNN